MQKLKIGILISGGGSNMHSIIRACKAPNFPVEVAVVISNRPEAKGINIAKDEEVPAFIIDHKDYDDRKSFEDALHTCLTEHAVEMVCNAGFMRILTEDFVDAWLGRQINIHPSLLPSFKGLHIHERVLEAGVKITGCSVHYVDLEVDAGAIVAQAAVPVLSGDNVESLASRVLEAEHQLYPHALRMIAEKRANLVGGVVKLKNDLIAEPSLYSPTLYIQ
ncbi:MAG: phosphoribosylglycinamide formyltransferase [Rhizobiales bacterium]|nr:phosphoribosylglycinamide formyltransferase [Hyphomicrobiales bacterium]